MLVNRFCRKKMISQQDQLLLLQLDMAQCEFAARARIVYDKPDQVRLYNNNRLYLIRWLWFQHN